jgi:hypothetical protein
MNSEKLATIGIEKVWAIFAETDIFAGAEFRKFPYFFPGKDRFRFL